MTLWEEFAGHAGRQPDKVAIVSHRTADARGDGGCPPDNGGGSRQGQSEVVSYGQLARLAERFAGALVELNVAPGEVVSFQLPNWWEVAALHLACVRIGAVANPMSTA